MDRCDICNEFIKLDRHHIQSLCYGGLDIEWNRCGLCPNCHRKVHSGDIVIEGWYRTTHSNLTLIYRDINEGSITGVKDPDVWLYGSNRKGGMGYDDIT